MFALTEPLSDEVVKLRFEDEDDEDEDALQLVHHVDYSPIP